MPLSDEDKQQMRLNWLEPAGSEQEAKVVDYLLKHHRLKTAERKLLLEWKNNGDKQGMHNQAFWKVAKKLKLGKENLDRALERHDMLPDNRWFVAYYVAQKKTNKEIEEALGLKRRGVDYHLDKIRQLIRREAWQTLSREEIGKWFIGM